MMSPTMCVHKNLPKQTNLHLSLTTNTLLTLKYVGIHTGTETASMMADAKPSLRNLFMLPTGAKGKLSVRESDFKRASNGELDERRIQGGGSRGDPVGKRDMTTTSRKFKELMQKGNVIAAIKLLTNNMKGGILPLNNQTMELLRINHPERKTMLSYQLKFQQYSLFQSIRWHRKRPKKSFCQLH